MEKKHGESLSHGCIQHLHLEDIFNFLLNIFVSIEHIDSQRFCESIDLSPLASAAQVQRHVTLVKQAATTIILQLNELLTEAECGWSNSFRFYKFISIFWLTYTKLI